MTMADSSMVLWSPKEVEIIPKGISAPEDIVGYAVQLSQRDKTHVAKGFQNGAFEMTMSYVWTKAMVGLLSLGNCFRLGPQFL